MIARTKIDMHAGTLLMEFGDNQVLFNIFEAMKHPTKDHSLFGIDVIDELVEEYMTLDTDNVEISNFVELPDVTDCFDFVTNVSDFDLSDSVNNIADLANLVHIFEFSDLTDLEYRCDGDLECSRCARIHVADTKRPVVAQVVTVAEAKVGQPNPRLMSNISQPHSPPDELKSLLDHLKHAYLNNH
ncbi:hypothetical protein CR513_03845, partial [Mucuna pruriens]